MHTAMNVTIPSSEGGVYRCRDFKVEQRSPDEFVIFTVAPFILEPTTKGESQSRPQ
jgi:hypothetical protein